MIRMSVVEIGVLKNIYTIKQEMFIANELSVRVWLYEVKVELCEISGYVKIVARSNVERELLSATWKRMCVWSS